jgi:hypothetical protein
MSSHYMLSWWLACLSRYATLKPRSSHSNRLLAAVPESSVLAWLADRDGALAQSGGHIQACVALGEQYRERCLGDTRRSLTVSVWGFGKELQTVVETEYCGGPWWLTSTMWLHWIREYIQVSLYKVPWILYHCIGGLSWRVSCCWSNAAKTSQGTCEGPIEGEAEISILAG